MHIIITGVQMEITDAIREYTFEKMKTLEKYVPKDDTSTSLKIEFSKESGHHNHGEIFKAEGILHIRGRTSSLKTTQDDLYKAIDTLKDMLVRDVAQYKDKERSIIRRSAQKFKNLIKRII